MISGVVQLSKQRLIQALVESDRSTDHQDLVDLVTRHESIMNDIERLIHIIAERKISEAEFNRKDQEKSFYYSEEVKMLETVTSIKANARHNCFLAKFLRSFISVHLLKAVEDHSVQVTQAWIAKYANKFPESSSRKTLKSWFLGFALDALPGDNQYVKLQQALSRGYLMQTFGNLRSAEEVIFYTVYLVLSLETVNDRIWKEFLTFLRAELGVPEDLIEFNRGLYFLDSLVESDQLERGDASVQQSKTSEILQLSLNCLCSRVTDWSQVSDKVLQLVARTFFEKSPTTNEFLLFLEVSAFTARSKENLKFYMDLVLKEPTSFIALSAVTCVIKSNHFTDHEKQGYMEQVVDTLIQAREVDPILTFRYQNCLDYR